MQKYYIEEMKRSEDDSVLRTYGLNGRYVITMRSLNS